ncbi:hypothetical protein [Metabacillus fastidiosus]|uniref:hypothetical protein n=1 Tax=Metabacillus fastidiosus TaxID=1458 RepID=UPI002E23A942|nr:hypothetical protein [Metabacillus fastidiosus]
MMRELKWILLLLLLCAGLTACKSNKVYENREKDIRKAIENQLQSFGIQDYKKYTITTKGTAGSAFDPIAYVFSYEYQGKEAIPFKSKVSINYNNPKNGAVGSGTIVEDYAKAYFFKGIHLDKVKKVLLDHFQEEEIQSVSTYEYSTFINEAELSDSMKYQEVEALIDRWWNATEDLPLFIFLTVKVNDLTKEEFQAIVHQLKDELPFGEYSFTVRVGELGEEWQAEIYVIK